MKRKVPKKAGRLQRIVMAEECCAANDVWANAEGCDDHSGAAQQLTNDNKV
jgi:hypothetical protein